jgi:AcrR family transcriptional regulator
MASRRDEIVDIAAGLFAEKGFVSTTVREIADRAGILSGSLYHHFDSKEAIAAEIVEKYYSGMVDRYREVVATGEDEADILADFIRIAYEGIKEQPNAVALITNSSDQLFQLESFGHIRQEAKELEEIWMRVLRGGVKKGIFHPSTDPRLTYTFIRDTIWPTTRWWRPGGRYSLDDIAERHIAMVLHGLLTPPGTTGNGSSRPSRSRVVVS